MRVRRRWYRGTFAAPKSRYGRRDVPLPPRLAQDLWNARKEAGADDARLVFPARTVSHWRSRARIRAIEPPEAAGPLGKPAHVWHTCATLLFRAGANAKQVQLWLGHHSPAFTLATYVHLLPSDLPDAGFMDTLTGVRALRRGRGR